MNTSQLKTFAQKARNMIRGGVARQLNYWGFDDNGNVECRPEKVEGGIVHREVITDDSTIIKRWDALHQAVKQRGFDQVVEEAAYTWFNRIMAIRILSKNGYDLPQLEYGADESQTPLILQRARRGQFAFLGRDEQIRLKAILPDFTKEPHAFAILLTGYCHSHTLLNNVFGRLVDYTELLLPLDMLSENGFIHFLNTTTAISDDDYRRVELIGWLYQFYISEKKDEVFRQFKKNKKAEAKDIPAATQIFTPNWIVKYMVENTVGKIWLNHHPDSPIKAQMKYLVETHSDVVIANREERSGKQPLTNEITELKLLDPASGSGHILVEGFDLMYQMYLEEYYMPEEAVESILKNNLFGLDIDLRAAQLACFAILMKAASKYPEILRKNIMPKVFAMPAPTSFSRQEILDFLGTENRQMEEKLTNALQLMQQAQNLGSTMQFDFTADERSGLVTQLENLKNLPIRDTFEEALLQKIAPFIEVLAILTDRYEAIAANPPYMGQGNMNGELKQYINTNYPLSKSDLFAVFIEVMINHLLPNARMGCITMESWMFLSSYEKLRNYILDNYSIAGLAHFGWHIIGIAFGTATLILEKSRSIEKGEYSYLTIDDVDRNTNLPFEFPKKDNGRYVVIQQTNFSKIPGSPIAYWVSENILRIFIYPNIKDFTETEGQTKTGDNAKYLRNIWEVNFKNIGKTKKWVHHPKGGTFRKWYGNVDTVIDWSIEARTHYRKDRVARIIPEYLWFRKGFCWNLIDATGKKSFRIVDENSIFNLAAPTLFPKNELDLSFLLGLLNSKLSNVLIEIFNPTLNNNLCDIQAIPVVYSNRDSVIVIAEKNLWISTIDWDSRETSWDFQQSPLVQKGQTLVQSFQNWQKKVSDDFYQLHENEEELNRIFIDIYGLNSELDPIVPLKDITILQDELDVKLLDKTDKALRKRRHWKLADGKWQLLADESKPLPELPVKRDVVMKQLVSYAVGCMMGRYSLQKPGLILASHGETLDDYYKLVQDGSPFEKGGGTQPGDGGLAERSVTTKIPENDKQNSTTSPVSPLRGDGRGAVVFLPDDDAIIPLMGSACTFPDDAVNRFNHFLEVVWGAETLTENKNFMEECLDQEIEKYLVRDFWKDHCRTYKKKPIYWLFASEKGAFQVLVYMHRMNRFTVEKIRSKYLLKHLQYLMQEKTMLENNSALLSREELKRLENLRAQYNECESYELLLKDCADRQIEFELDNGVTVNYELFKGVVVAIK